MSAPYMSEKDLGDYLFHGERLDDIYRALGLNPATYAGSSFREMEVGYRKRVDFGLVGFSHCFVDIQLIELKITADAQSVAQLANYVWLAAKNIRPWIWARSEHNPAREDAEPVTGTLIARYFDRDVYSLAEEAGIFLVRAIVGSDGEVDLQPEGHIFEDIPRDAAVLNALSKTLTENVRHIVPRRAVACG